MKRFIPVALALLAVFLLTSTAHAELTSANTVDQLIQQFQSSAQSWQSVILNAARSLFGTLALISLVLTVGLLFVSGQAEVGSITAALVRFCIFNGLSFWAMNNGPAFAHNIIDSFLQLGGQASGASKGLAPTMFLDLSFGLYQKVLSHQTLMDIGGSVCAEIIGILIVLCSAWMTANLVLVLCSSWILASAGCLFLAFGALEWTRDIAVNFWRTVIAMGARVMVMVLVMGIGYTFMQRAVSSLSDKTNGGELVVLLAASFVLALLSHSLPNMIASIVGHGAHGIGNLGMGIGAAAGGIVGSAINSGISGVNSVVEGFKSGLKGEPTAVQKAAQQAEQHIANGSNGNGANGERAASNGQSNGNGANKEETVSRS